MRAKGGSRKPPFAPGTQRRVANARCSLPRLLSDRNETLVYRITLAERGFSSFYGVHSGFSDIHDRTDVRGISSI